MPEKTASAWFIHQRGGDSSSTATSPSARGRYRDRRRDRIGWPGRALCFDARQEALKSKERIQGGQIKNAFRGACRRARITNFHPHDCRDPGRRGAMRLTRSWRADGIGRLKSVAMVLRSAHNNKSDLAAGVLRIGENPGGADLGTTAFPENKAASSEPPDLDMVGVRGSIPLAPTISGRPRLIFAPVFGDRRATVPRPFAGPTHRRICIIVIADDGVHRP